MKQFMIGFLTLFSLFGFYTQGDTDIDVNKITYESTYIKLTLQAKSDNLMVIEQDFTYNPDEIELYQVDNNSYFTYTEGKEKKNEDGTVTIKMLFDSEYAFESVEYAQIYLKPKNETVDTFITIDNIHSSDLDYKNENVYGSVYEITTENDNVKITKEKTTIQVQLKTWILTNKEKIIAILIIILVLSTVIKILKKLIRLKIENKKAFTDKTIEKNNETKLNLINNTGKEEKIENKVSKDEIEDEKQAQKDLKTIENKEKDDPISDDIFKGRYEIFIILLLVSSLLLIPKIYAENTNKIELIRTNIVNEKKYDSDLDYNNDKKVNIVDLVYAIGTKDVKNKGYINFNSSIYTKNDEENKNESE